MNTKPKVTGWLLTGLCLASLLGANCAQAARLAGDEVSPAVPAVSAPVQKAPPLKEPAPVLKNASQTATPAAVETPAEPEKTVRKMAVRKKHVAPAKQVRNKSVKPVNTRQDEAPAAAATAKGKPGEYVTIDFDNVDIGVFIKTIGEMTGKNFVVDNQVKGNVTIFSPKKITLAEAYKVFESVLEVHGYSAIPSGGVVKVVPAKDAKEKSIETRLGSDYISGEDKIVTRIVTLKHANPDEIKRILDPLIARSSIVLSYPPSGMLVITDIQSNIKRLIKIIDSLDLPGSGEQITVLPLKNAGAAEAAKALTSIFQADQAQRRSASQSVRVIPDERTNALIVVATEFYTNRVKQLLELLDRDVPKGDSTMHTYRLQNANAEDLAKVLINLPQKDSDKSGAEKGKEAVLSKNIQIIADKATNTLVIRAARDDYRVLEDVIKSLDVARAMVYLEALIMEVDVNKSFKLGVEWRGMTTSGNTGIFAGSGGLSSQTSPGEYSIFSTPTTTTVGSSTVTSASFPSGFAMGIIKSGITVGGVTFPSIGAALQAIQQDQDIHILSTPQILTMDNEDAEIRVGSNIPYVTRQDTSSSTVAYSTYEYKDVGMTLKVTPHINEDGYVRMKIAQELTSLVSQTQSVSSSTSVIAPTTLKRAANTTVIVKDNTTVVIGGIIGDSSTKTNYGVPWLSKIPVIGYLFKSKSDVREQTNLFVFLTPRIVRTHTDAASINKEKRGQIDEIKEGVIKLQENRPEEKR